MKNFFKILFVLLFIGLLAMYVKAAFFYYKFSPADCFIGITLYLGIDAILNIIKEQKK